MGWAMGIQKRLENGPPFAEERNRPACITACCRILLVPVLCTVLIGCAGKGSGEIVVLGGIILFLTYAPIKTLILGIVTALLGAFLPSSVVQGPAGKVAIGLGDKKSITVGGTLRFLLVSIGLVVVAGALFQGASNAIDAHSAKASPVKQNNSKSNSGKN